MKHFSLSVVTHNNNNINITMIWKIYSVQFLSNAKTLKDFRAFTATIKKTIRLIETWKFIHIYIYIYTYIFFAYIHIYFTYIYIYYIYTYILYILYIYIHIFHIFIYIYYNLGNQQQQYSITLCFIGVTQSSDGLQHLFNTLSQ